MSLNSTVSTVRGNDGSNATSKSGSTRSVGPDVKPDAKPGTIGPQIWPATSPDELRRMLLAPEGPTVPELAKFRELAEVEVGFDDMKRNMAAAANHPAAFDQYKQGWNAICDLLQEVANLRKRNAELDAENDMILDLMSQVSQLKVEVARLEKENEALRQDNADTKEILHSKLSGIESWLRIDQARACAHEAGEAAPVSQSG